MISFDEIPHDSVIKEIIIDRRDPGNIDTISITLSIEEAYLTKITFSEIYYASFDLNFGIAALESVCLASLDPENETINKIKEEWKSIGVEIPNLQCFVINTNSTNSTLKIYALDFSVTLLPNET